MLVGRDREGKRKRKEDKDWRGAFLIFSGSFLHVIMWTDWKEILAAHISNRLTRFFIFFSFLELVIFILPFFATWQN